MTRARADSGLMRIQKPSLGLKQRNESNTLRWNSIWQYALPSGVRKAQSRVTPPEAPVSRNASASPATVFTVRSLGPDQRRVHTLHDDRAHSHGRSDRRPRSRDSPTPLRTRGRRATRSREKLEALRDLGAEPVLCDVYDCETLLRVTERVRPRVVVNFLADLADGSREASNRRVTPHPRDRARARIAPC